MNRLRKSSALQPYEKSVVYVTEHLADTVGNYFCSEGCLKSKKIILVQSETTGKKNYGIVEEQNRVSVMTPRIHILKITGMNMSYHGTHTQKPAEKKKHHI